MQGLFLRHCCSVHMHVRDAAAGLGGPGAGCARDVRHAPLGQGTVSGMRVPAELCDAARPYSFASGPASCRLVRARPFALASSGGLGYICTGAAPFVVVLAMNMAWIVRATRSYA